MELTCWQYKVIIIIILIWTSIYSIYMTTLSSNPTNEHISIRFWFAWTTNVLSVFGVGFFLWLLFTNRFKQTVQSE